VAGGLRTEHSEQYRDWALAVFFFVTLQTLNHLSTMNVTSAWN
jgi:hypothetical protein